MARPQKIGLDYFPMDCFLDKNLKTVIRKFNAEGFGVIVGLYQHIYSEGYYVTWNDEIAEDFAFEFGVDEKTLTDIIEFCVKRNVFNSDIYNTNKVLTSRGIQKRYLLATERRKCKQLLKFNLVNVDINPTKEELMHAINPVNPVNDYISTQSKEKESKEKESKEKESKEKNKENKIDSSNNSNKEAINEIVDYLNSKTGKKYRSSTDDTVSKIKARLNDKYTIEDFKKVIDTKVNNWTGTEQERFIQPSTLFGNKFDLYLNESLIVKTDKEQDGIANMLGFGDSTNMPFKVIMP